jgi:hypothetical protein
MISLLLMVGFQNAEAAHYGSASYLLAGQIMGNNPGEVTQEPIQSNSRQGSGVQIIN